MVLQILFPGGEFRSKGLKSSYFASGPYASVFKYLILAFGVFSGSKWLPDPENCKNRGLEVVITCLRSFLMLI